METTETQWMQGECSTLNNMVKAIHENAVAHGWWEGSRSFPEIIALIHSELSEALEEYRAGRPMLYHICTSSNGETLALCDADIAKHHCGVVDCVECEDYDVKPEGIAVELADALIRILDYCGHEHIDIDAIVREKHEYNKTRPYRHGGKIV